MRLATPAHTPNPMTWAECAEVNNPSTADSPSRVSEQPLRPYPALHPNPCYGRTKIKMAKIMAAAETTTVMPSKSHEWGSSASLRMACSWCAQRL